MTDDHRAELNFTNEQLERFAEEFRARNNLEEIDQVDIMKCFEVGWIWTLKGNKKLEYLEIDDHLLGDRDAEATSDKQSAVVRVKKSLALNVKKFFKSGEGGAKAKRDVFTLGHELAHVALCHEFGSRGRKSGASGSSHGVQFIRTFESTERHANYWAGAVLVGRTRLHSTDTPEAVSARFGVSIGVAKARLDQVFRRKNAVVIKGFKELLERLGASKNESTASIPEKNIGFATTSSEQSTATENFGLCPECGENSLCCDHGNNYSCRNLNCRARNVKLQDGDPF